MKVKLKIIEFSSDIFSKSSQLKDIQISPLFSNINFSINIFDAISKNDEYEIKTNTPIIKIGLYQGKSLLGIGEIDINKKSQRIKIASEKKNQNNLFMSNSSVNKPQDNDYYIILECVSVNTFKDNIKDSKQKKKKNASVDNKIYNKNKGNKNKLNNSLKEYFNKYNLENKKNIDNNRDSNNNLINNNSTLNQEKNRIENNILYDSKSNNKNKTNEINEKESNEFYFNESFQKENFSDGVLILNTNYKSNNNNDISYTNSDEMLEYFPKMENIEINNFNSLIHDFNLIYSNVNNNNLLSLDNIKENFTLEYQYFSEKTSDIFNLYFKLSSNLNKQNIQIRKYIHNLNNKIKALYKKDKALNIKTQNININELNKNILQETKKNFSYEIKSINNKLSLINYMNNDFLLLINNFTNSKKIEFKKLFEIVLGNEKITKFIKGDENLIKFLKHNRNKIRINLDGNETGKKFNSNLKLDENINEDENDNKIDIERLKDKIDKVKNQYINETIPKEQKNKNNLNENNKKKKIKEIKTKIKPNHHYSYNRSEKNIHDIKKNKYDSSNVTEIYNEYKNNKFHNYYNSPNSNGNRKNRLIKYDL